MLTKIFWVKETTTETNKSVNKQFKHIHAHSQALLFARGRVDGAGQGGVKLFVVRISANKSHLYTLAEDVLCGCFQII